MPQSPERRKELYRANPEKYLSRVRASRQIHGPRWNKLQKCKRYGITPEHYDEMWARQEGCCAICGGCYEELAVDHCHRTGKVRALLCHLCNQGLGLFRESASHLQNAIAYLDYHHPECEE